MPNWVENNSTDYERLPGALDSLDMVFGTRQESIILLAVTGREVRVFSAEHLAKFMEHDVHTVFHRNSVFSNQNIFRIYKHVSKGQLRVLKKLFAF